MPGPAGPPGTELEDTLAAAVARHGDRLVLLCSFQKEESVLLDALARTPGGDAVRVVTIDTGVLFPETIATWKAFEDRWGVAIEVQDASAPDGLPWTAARCCGDQKVAALERALDGAEGWVTGIRREQSPTRAGARAVEHDARRGIAKYNPLVAWTDGDLWARIAERDLPYHALHDRGYASIGCAPCTQPGEGRAGRWAGSEKLECGLHPDAVPGAAGA